MSKLTNSQVKQWLDRLEEGVMFLVGIEIRQRSTTMTQLLKHYAGDLNKIPSVEDGVNRMGHAAPRQFTEELLKTQYDMALKDASDDVLWAISDEKSKLHKELRHKFVDVYFKCNYAAIVKNTKDWEIVRPILEAGKEMAAAFPLEGIHN